MDSLDCKRFQKTAGADLNALDQSLLAHVEGCADCDAFLKKARRFDKSLAAAIKVDVPNDLIQKLLHNADEVGSGQAGGSNRFPRFMAVAASVLLIVGASFMVNRVAPVPTQSLEQVVLSHIEAEPKMLTLASFVPDDVAKARLLDFGIEMKRPMGKVSHIELCDIGETQGVHIVMEGEKGPVTLLFLPTIPSQTTRFFSEGRWVGYTAPAGEGTLAIVGEVGEPLEEIDSSVRDAIKWL